MFKLEIDTSNDAFKPNPAAEIAVMLLELAMYLKRENGFPGSKFTLRDSNGNRVGTATLTSEE